MRKEGRFIKYDPTRLALYSCYNLVKGLQARSFCFADPAHEANLGFGFTFEA